MKAGFVISVIWMAMMAPQTAHACLIELPSCEHREGTAYLYDHRDTVVLFDDALRSGDRRVVLVECRTRRGVAVTEDPANLEPFWAAESFLSEAIHSDQVFTLAQIAEHSRGLGADAVSITLGQGHCGCDLPNVPRPPNNCPQF